MLPGNMNPAVGATGTSWSPTYTLFSQLTTLSLTTNLKLCLDEADSSSYSSGQKWLDRTAGGYDFFLGTTSGAESSDPTFNGTPGGRSSSEYWSFDGGDCFTYDTTNESWMQNLHKDSAKFTVMAWIRRGASLPVVDVFGTCAASPGSQIGVYMDVPSAGTCRIFVLNGSGSAFSGASTVTMPTSAFCFVSVAIDEAANTCVIGTGDVTNGFVTKSMACTYSTPSASSATGTMTLGAFPGALFFSSSGQTMSQVAMWEQTALSESSLQSIFEATRGRYGV